jgi:plasmid replication initiation protein
MARPSKYGELQTELFAFPAENLAARLKNLEPFMGTAWFSMEKSHRTEPIRHEYQKYWVEINGGPEGIATYWDQDILLFAYSQIISSLNKGDEVSRKIHFTGPDLFRFTGQKWQGSKDYAAVVKALRRLQGTTIRTNIKPMGDILHAEMGVSWIEQYESFLSDNVTTFSVVLPETFYNVLNQRKNWLTLDHSYFSIMGGLERFLYTWGRKSTGFKNEDTWEESFNSIYEKSGSRMKPAKFRHKLRGIIRNQTLPGYVLEEIFDIKKGPSLSLKRDVRHPLLLSTKKIRKSKLSRRSDSQLNLPI